jgi:ABC-2 type transport system permease protein
MKVVGTIVAREYLARVRTKTFVISTLAAPVILLLIVLIPALSGARSALAESRIALLDRTGVLGDAVSERLAELGFEVDAAEPSPTIDIELAARIDAQELAGVLVLDEATLERGVATWRGRSPPSTLRRFGIQQAVVQAALVRRLVDMEEGEAIVNLLAGGSLRLETPAAEERPEEDRAAGMVAGFAGAFLIYMVLLIYGSAVLRAVLEEKTGRIVEVVISSIRPWELMLGKIVGVGAVGLTQLAIFALFGVILVAMGIPALLPLLPEGVPPVDLAEFIPSAGVLAFFLVCFLCGYFLYASLFAAVGAMCTSEEEAQQIQLPVLMLVVVPVVFLMPVLEDPDSTLALWLSLFPFFTPILMFARVATGAAPAWQAALSVGLMLGTLLVTAWVAGRIYRTGILMQGKRPTLPELWRWIRAG